MSGGTWFGIVLAIFTSVLMGYWTHPATTAQNGDAVDHCRGSTFGVGIPVLGGGIGSAQDCTMRAGTLLLKATGEVSVWVAGTWHDAAPGWTLPRFQGGLVEIQPGGVGLEVSYDLSSQH